MTHASEVILEVLERAHQVALKEGHNPAPDRLPGICPDPAFHIASLAALRRLRRIVKLAKARNPHRAR